MAATVERRQHPDGQPATARPILPSPDIPHLNQGQSRWSRTGIPLPAVGRLWPAQVPHARPSAATPWPPAVQLEAPYCVGGLLVGTHAVVALLVRLHVQSLPMEIQIDDFSHIIGKYSEIPRDDRRSNVSPGLWESLAPGREVRGVLTLSLWVIVQLYEASGWKDQRWRPEAGWYN